MSRTLRDEDYLEHIQDAIAKIGRYTDGVDETDFMADELRQDGVIRNMEVIGEAVTKLSPALKAKHADVPWGDIAGMRNRLIHGYMEVNLELVWDTARQVIQAFRARVAAIQRALNQPAPRPPSGCGTPSPC
jgi:uncharacterized protein with HEPN domain